MSAETAPEAVVSAYVDACNAGDIDRVRSVLHRDVELHEAANLPGAVSSVGYDEVIRYLERFDAHWSAVNWEPLETRVAGNRVLMGARLHLEGRRSGIEVDREWYYVFTVRDGKLWRQDGFDTAAAAEVAFGA